MALPTAAAPPLTRAPALLQDGRFARKFDQCSTFGAVLDMVTDRLSTAGLCVVLAVLRPVLAHFFLACVCLDVGAHWAQMYASLLARSASHKDVAASASPLLRLYYSNRVFMGSLCVAQEVFYLALYMTSFPAYGAAFLPTGLSLPSLLVAALPQLLPRGPLGGLQLLAVLVVPQWTLKQVTNCLQGQFAAQRLAAADLPAKLK